METVRILQNLQYYEVKKTLFEEVFPIQRFINVEEPQNNEGFKLSGLHLYEMPKLRHFWNEGSQMNASILQNLGHLFVSSCGILNMPVLSSLSFRNLTELKVEKCHELTYLLNPSVARTLVKLELLVLKRCKRMTTVIAGVEEENDEILFNRLKVLSITHFSKLISFHSGKCSIRFPHLGRIVIAHCPEMRGFSHGIVSTPCLPTENIGYYDHTYKGFSILKDSKEIIVVDINVIVRQIWEDNYDTNIQYLFEEQDLEETQSDRFSSHVEELESE